MRFFELKSDVNNYSWIDFNEKYYKLLSEMRGESLINKWKPLNLRKLKEKPELPLGDYPTFSEPIVSEKAKNILECLCTNIAEFLPVTIHNSDQNYYLFNVTNILDCLDHHNSTIKYFSDGRIMEIQVYSFNNSITSQNRFFRIKGYEKSIYVNEEIKSIIDNNNLNGFIFVDTALPYENPFKKLLKK